ncbi:zinc finger protein constans-like 10 [Anaeramoeba ignava]|uniref:Zinc finger protein constans-like 10 n=1 Tax=Anaeramoeba ignava TaxID=1746090 RepID=A0A9Q0LJT2_ANAIG|nr:zinc finger protein constans-like 10 [Anaeramoeba ignava]
MNQFRTRIPKQTEEFGTVEYKLQLGLNLPTLEITKLYSLNNPHLTLSFEQNSSEMMILDSFVDPREIKSPNSIESIFARGFLIDPEEGLSFNVGQLLLEKNTSNQYQLILCKIAIKRPFLTDKTLSKDDIPKDFDCLSLKSDSSQNFLNNSSYFFDSFKKLFFSQDFFSNKFVLFEKSKILPTHFVKFKIDDGQIQNTNKNKPLCDFCEKKPAIIWCQNDQARFCKACDEEYHSSNKLLQRHVRIPISEAEEITEKCFYHSDQNIEFYCPTCKMALCVHCKMVGNHSTGESSTHKLVSIKHAYSNILKTSKKPDPLLLQRKSSISKQTIAVKKRISEIETNGENIKARTREIMNQIISSIDGITEKKLEVLNSDLTNLQRQEKEIDWLLGFLNRQQEIQSPLAFIASWDHGALKILKKTDNGEYTTEAFLSAETQVKNQFNPEDFQTLKFPSQNTFTKTPNIPTKTSSRLRKSLFRSAGVLFENQKSSGEKKTYHQTPKKRESIVPLTGEPTVQESFGAFDSPILGVQQKSRQKEKVFGLWNSALKKNQQQQKSNSN